ncbi:comF family protein [Algoriphagus locisalis]|uniref:ComF family protein n=1 Tax=Algoriphagus locisalis TaxID=305507 RepID=A0A1I7D8E8_9BACT|nr:ComF family protein [Algoriphagus locisalis]SFU07834.1 comF family protein [Algoriphagus locisalis]
MRLFFVKDFLDLVFPRNCLLCGSSLFDHENNLCSVCKGTLPVTSYHLRAADNDLCDKVMGLSNVGMVMAYLKFTKGGNSQKLLHQLKYRNKPQLARELGSLYGKILCENGFSNQWDVIIPVPLHPLKQSRRGYNQSEEFGLGLTEELSVKLINGLTRVKFTETQTQKSRLQRMDNMDDVFQIAPYALVANKSVLLVDDVMTTGATLCACANVLLANGAKNVDLVTIAAGG